MAKNKMKLKYKPQKRERNKQVERTTKDEVIRVIKNVLGILIFLAIAYLCVYGMTKLGLFEKGYTAPEKEDATIDTDYIAMGSVFNRKDKEYYVIFDNYKDSYVTNTYIDTLLKNKVKTKIYKVDMGQNENKKFISDEENTKPKNASDLKIKDITLIKFKNGKVDRYISGNEAIEAYLNK